MAMAEMLEASGGEESMFVRKCIEKRRLSAGIQLARYDAEA